ncbi:MAG: peptidoglycan DD-metalloendopeptidase family protein [Pseudomonadota bacterium]|nr:peptidoglycan DD-metalloendopeptidase family protein [Pseudomonadota bacterium]
MAAVHTVAPVAVLFRPQKLRRPRLGRGLRVLWFGLFWIGMLGGCAAPGTPPVTDRSLANRNQQTYVVVRGDTLYSIAWRFNLDHRRLATANGIVAPFTIYPGQKLRLSETPKSTPAKVAKTSGSLTDGGVVATRKPAPNLGKIAKPAVAPKPAVVARTRPKLAQQSRSTAATPKRASSTPRSGQTWYRPLPQRPSVPFGNNNKGLDYAITARSKVRSTRSGEVVYAGNGIAGFERLVIVKHTTDLLSAYSFNGKVQVAEQQRVRGGAVIAEILPRPGVGQKLHFEVRRKGLPINPATVLPKS